MQSCFGYAGRVTRWAVAAFAVVVALGIQPGTAAAQVVQVSPWETIRLEPLAEQFAAPIYLTAPQDGTDRLFLVERAGQIRVRVDGVWQETPFLDIRDRVAAAPGECGMTGLAFPPGFGRTDEEANGENDVFYVYYTSNEDLVQPPAESGEPNEGCDSVVARFRLSENPNVADAGGEERILLVNQPSPLHQGGAMVFGPDGYLYVAMGDGSDDDDSLNSAQRLDTLLGKILRLDVQNTDTYRIPNDNPFVEQAQQQPELGIRPEIWAYGLRNPYRIAFDPLTDELYIADVGAYRWEEINIEPADSPGGANYGWVILEGPDCFIEGSECSPPDNYVPPVYAYPHVGAPPCTAAIIGGHVYRGVQPGLQGTYIYGDFCRGTIFGLRRAGDLWHNALFLETEMRIFSFGEDAVGNIYVMGIARGQFGVYQIRVAPIAAYVPLLHGSPSGQNGPVMPLMPSD